MDKDWVTTTQAAELSGYHRDHIRRLIRNDEIEAKKWGRDWMVNRKSLIDYLRKWNVS